MDSIINPLGAKAMSTPSDFVPSYSIYLSETAQRPLIGFLGSIESAKDMAQRHGLRSYVIRRSTFQVFREIPRGMIVHTVR